MLRKTFGKVFLNILSKPFNASRDFARSAVGQPASYSGFHSSTRQYFFESVKTFFEKKVFTGSKIKSRRFHNICGTYKIDAVGEIGIEFGIASALRSSQ
jgi:hypothetical protein